MYWKRPILLFIYCYYALGISYSACSGEVQILIQQDARVINESKLGNLRKELPELNKLSNERKQFIMSTPINFLVLQSRKEKDRQSGLEKTVFELLWNQGNSTGFIREILSQEDYDLLWNWLTK